MKRLIIAGTIVLLLLVGLSLVTLGANSAAKADTGVTACQEMANRQNSGSQGSGNMTEESYVKALEPFEASEYADLKDAGVAFVTSVWNSQKVLESVDEATLGTSFGILTDVHAKYAALQIACAKHGVELKSLT